MPGADLSSGDFTKGYFVSADLSSARFYWATLTNATLTNADARGATGMSYTQTSLRQNFIQPDGIVQGGFALAAGQTMRIWDYQGPTPLSVRVQGGFSMQAGSGLEMLFQDGVWGSTVVLEGGVASLSGALTLRLADGVTPMDLGVLGTTFQIFNWSGASSVSGRFSQIIQVGSYGGYYWDTSNLYTLGTIQLVPEPGSSALTGLAGLLLGGGWLLRRRR